MRRQVCVLAMVIGTLSLAIVASDSGVKAGGREDVRWYGVVEAGIPEIQAALEAGAITSRQLVEEYLNRINRYEGLLNAVIAINPYALDRADELDRERREGHVRGPLHGIPIAVKDNTLARDMPTTGGALAFAGYYAPYDATLVTNLQRAGAIIIAKTVLTELANWVTVGMPANYSSFGGYGMNPYDPRPDPRPNFNDGRPALSTGGSSSGIGTAASLWAASIGTETSGSILSPSNQNMLVGIKPTIGRVSRYGVIPIVADQDIAGPMARTVEDVATLFGAIDGFDPNDPSTQICQPPPGHDYTRFLRHSGLQGARIGIPRALYYNAITPPGATTPSGGLNAAQAALMVEAIEIIRRAGATVVDPANIPSVVDGTLANNVVPFGICVGTRAENATANCSTVLEYGFKRDFQIFLDTLGPSAPVKSLTELRAFNVRNAANNTLKYGQTILDNSDAIDLVADRARYEADRAKDIRLADTHGIGEAMDIYKLDALLFPGVSSAGIAAKAGFPTITVPFGTIPNAPTPPFPDGFNAGPAPYGISFTSTACNEPRLIELAFAFEQLTKRRVPPAATP